MRMADRHLICKCLDGDSAAFGMLVERYKEGVYALAYSMLHNFHDAEDITQEAFIKAYQNLRKLRGWDEFHAWLYAITSNLCKDWIRIKSRQPDCEFIEDQPDKLLDQYSSDSPYNNMIDQLHEALESLPDTYQQVLTLHYLGGMDGVEIAKFLGVSPTSIWQRLSRARSLLKKEMLDMMSETFEQNRLKAGFTFHVIEMVKRIRINPMPPKTLPWGLSLATGVIIAILGIGAHINVPNNESYLSGSANGESKVLNVGEYPVDVTKVSDITVMSNQYSIGNGLGSTIPSLQNSLFMAPQAEGGTWTKKADMPTARCGFATSLLNGKIYAIGGNGAPSKIDEYDPKTDTWTQKADIPYKIVNHSACTVNRKIYVIGGLEIKVSSRVEEYDPITDTWIRKADMPTARANLSIAVVNGKIYAVGGGDDFNRPISTVEEYDTVTDKWIWKTDVPTITCGFSASVVNEKIYIFGGTFWRNPDWVASSRVEEYDPVTDKWKNKTDMLTPRGYLSTSVVNGKIYAVGGSENGNVNVFSTVEEYDPITDKWTKKTDMPTPRYWLSTCAVNGKIYAIGGANKEYISAVEEYDTGFSGEGVNFKGKLPTTWGETKIALRK